MSMFNTKNIFWAIYNNQAKIIQGWFHKDGDLLTAMSKKIELCSNEKDLNNLCRNLENILSGGIPQDMEKF